MVGNHEPHCGTDLGLLKTKAIPQGDGSYQITGQKIWISGGEHDLSDNIIHLVLARIEGAPQGIKGVSLFIVPKFLVNEDGTLGERNGVTCGGLEEKMGIHANSTCVMNYDGATGFLVGEANKGMRGMFVMMNEARLSTGLQGACLSEVAYQNALGFARDRRQGRSLSGPREPDQTADNILVHPDVRRMLLDVRCVTEGARAFVYWASMQQDLKDHAPDEETRQKADDYLALLTPVVKAYVSQKGLLATIDAQQVLGGSGFCEEWGMSQFVRDARIAPIYEGTNGVQALDLVGRKLPAAGGRYWQSYFAELQALIEDTTGEPGLEPFVNGLASVLAKLQEATMSVAKMGMGDPNQAAGVSHDYLHLFGLTAMAHMWLQVARKALPQEGKGDPFYERKMQTARYFLARHLPEAETLIARINGGSDVVLALDEKAFA